MQSDTSELAYTCPACGKTYRVSTVNAGKKVRCKCGNVGIAPTMEPGGALEVVEDGLAVSGHRPPSAATKATVPTANPSHDLAKRQSNYVCAKCGDVHAVKAEFIGKTIRCKCGHTGVAIDAASQRNSSAEDTAHGDIGCAVVLWVFAATAVITAGIVSAPWWGWAVTLVFSALVALTGIGMLFGSSNNRARSAQSSPPESRDSIPEHTSATKVVQETLPPKCLPEQYAELWQLLDETAGIMARTLQSIWSKKGIVFGASALFEMRVHLLMDVFHANKDTDNAAKASLLEFFRYRITGEDLASVTNTPDCLTHLMSERYSMYTPEEEPNTSVERRCLLVAGFLTLSGRHDTPQPFDQTNFGTHPRHEDIWKSLYASDTISATPYRTVLANIFTRNTKDLRHLDMATMRRRVVEGLKEGHRKAEETIGRNIPPHSEHGGSVSHDHLNN